MCSNEMSVMVALISICSANEYHALLSNRGKLNDVEYGERLSSVENSEMEAKRSRLFFTGKEGRHLLTKCTAGQPITTDPSYIPSSDEDDKNDAKKLTTEEEDAATEDAGPKKVYEPPPTARSPDHYIDDD